MYTKSIRTSLLVCNLGHDADEERGEVQEAVLTFANDEDAPSGSDRKTSTISVTLREEVIKSSASFPRKNWLDYSLVW